MTGGAREVLGWRAEPLTGYGMSRVDRDRRPGHQGLMPARHLYKPHLPFARFRDDGSTVSATCERTRFEAAGASLGGLDGHHSVPHPECQCGYRIVPNIGVLAAYLRKQEAQVRLRKDLSRNRIPVMGIYQVRGFGIVLDSGAAFDDPPSSVRVSDMQMLDSVLLPATGVGRAAARHLRRIQPVQHVHYLENLRWVSASRLPTR